MTRLSLAGAPTGVRRTEDSAAKDNRHHISQTSEGPRSLPRSAPALVLYSLADLRYKGCMGRA
jgi:hypothetical protein